MMKNRVVPCLLAAAAACAAALLLWALAVRFPGPLTRALSPVQVSPWEMGKAAFFPLLAASPLLWRLEKGGGRGGLCLMALAGAVLTNDSGLMHVAAATGRPVVAVFGSSTPGYTPPLTDRAEILQTDIKCRPCFRRTCKYGHYKCLKDITPEMAEEALTRITARESGAA